MPKTDKHINDFLDKIKISNLTSVFFVSSHKLKNFLKSLENKLPNRPISISKELTKINERTFRGMGSEINHIISMDSDNLNSVYSLFQYLKSQFQFTLIVSHIDSMRDAVDTLLEIKKEKNYSNIMFD